MTYEVTVRKIVSESVEVDAPDAATAKYWGECQCSDTGCEEILDAAVACIACECGKPIVQGQAHCKGCGKPI
jgi:hypothetical protein